MSHFRPLILPLLLISAIPGAFGCYGFNPPMEKTDIILAPRLAEICVRHPDQFDSEYANHVIVLAGLIKNPSEENPSTGKRYLVLWGYERPEDKGEDVVRCEYIPEFDAITTKDRVKISGKVLVRTESNQGITLGDCHLLGIRKLIGDKNGDGSDADN